MTPPLLLILAMPAIGVIGLRVGSQMAYPKGPGLVDVWQRGWKVAALVVGTVGLVAGVVNLVRWLAS